MTRTKTAIISNGRTLRDRNSLSQRRRNHSKSLNRLAVRMTLWALMSSDGTSSHGTTTTEAVTNARLLLGHLMYSLTHLQENNLQDPKLPQDK